MSRPRATVLVVDDDAEARETVSKVLARAHYGTVQAGDVATALEQAACSPDVALIDLNLPDGNGAELAQALQRRLPGVPAILMTGCPHRLREEKELARPFRGVLAKPFNLVELCQAVDSALDEKPMNMTMRASDADQAAAPLAVPSPVKATVSKGLPLPTVVGSRLPVKAAAGIAAAAVLAAGVLVFLGVIPPPWKLAASPSEPPPEQLSDPLPAVELVPGKPHTLAIPEDVCKALGLGKGASQSVAVAKVPTHMQEMVLPGSTLLDPGRLFRIRARFAPARVIKIGETVDAEATLKNGRTQFRELRDGDRVHKGDLLGVLFSPDVGNKKNDLIDALVQLKLDQAILDMAKKRQDVVPVVFLLNAEKSVSSDVNAVSRAVSNLRTWDIPEEDIQAVYKEAEEIGKRNGKRDPEKDKLWPRVELHAPADGVLVEQNVVQDELVVDNTVNLFQLADVDRLRVLVNAPEDDLPTLNALTGADRSWTVRTVGANPSKGLVGPIDSIGYIIDPNQHTAVIKGHIDNLAGTIRGGQFVSATVKIPPPKGVVEVPIDAISEDGQMCVVFVQSDPAKREYTMRRVQPTHRFDKTAFIRSEPIPQNQQRTHEEEELGVQPREPLHPGDIVLTTAVGELKATLLDKESQPKKDEKSGND